MTRLRRPKRRSADEPGADEPGANEPGADEPGAMTKEKKNTGPDHPSGLDVHGAEPVEHRFTTVGDDGSPDIEFQLVLPLTPKRHRQFEHLLEEGYSPHEAYTLLAGGEILAHIETMKKAKEKN